MKVQEQHPSPAFPYLNITILLLVGFVMLFPSAVAFMIVSIATTVLLGWMVVSVLKEKNPVKGDYPINDASE